MKRPVIEVTATVTFTYDLLDVYRVVSNEATAIEDVQSMIDSDELTAEQFTITARTFDAEPCPRCEGSGEVTRPGTATRDSNGVWDRETMPCPECSDAVVHLGDLHRFGYGICGAPGETTDGGTGPGALEDHGVTCPNCLGLWAKREREAESYED